MTLSLLIAIVYVVLAAVLLLLGTIVFKENPKARINRVTGSMLFYAGLGPVFAAVGAAFPALFDPGEGGRAPMYYDLYLLWELFFPQLIFFALVFPVENPAYERFRRTKYLVFVPHVFHIVWVLFMYDSDLAWLNVDDMTGLTRYLLLPLRPLLSLLSLLLQFLFTFHIKFFSFINLFYIATAVILLRAGFRHYENPRLQQQVRVLIGGLVSGIGLYALAFLLPAIGLLTLPDWSRHVLAILALLIAAGTIAWSIVRHQFLDINLIVRESLVFSLSSALLVGIYLVVITQIGDLIKDTLELATPLIDIAFIILVLVFFQPIKEQVDDVIRRLFLRARTDPRAIIAAFSRQIATVLDVDVIKGRVIEILTRDLLIQQAYFAIRDESADAFILELPPGNGSGRGETVARAAAQDPLVARLKGFERPAYLEELIGEDKPSELAGRLRESGCHLIVPIREGERLMAFICLGNKMAGYRYGVEDINLLTVLSNQLAVAIINARLYGEALEKRALEEELNIARQIQLQLLPREFPRAPSYSVSAFNHPSRQVGGDYYDFFVLDDDRLGMVIADVSGKGVGAALMVSQLQAVLKSEVRSGRSMEVLMANVNDLMSETTAVGRFATLVYAVLDTTSGQLSCCNAGHNYPIIIRTDGSHEFIPSGGLLLGVFPGSAYTSEDIQLHPSDTVLLYTDGLSELNSPDGEEYGEERLIEFLTDNRHLSAEDLKTRIIHEATRFAFGDIGFDDLTLTVLRYHGNESGASQEQSVTVSMG